MDILQIQTEELNGWEGRYLEKMIWYLMKNLSAMLILSSWGRTYRQLVTVLSPDEWIYPNLASYIITHFPEQSTDNIKFTMEEPSQLVMRLKGESGKNIWICGGADIVKQLVQADVIDQYFINVMPTILGGGIRLFDGLEKERKLKLIKTKSYNGITDLVYERRINAR